MQTIPKRRMCRKRVKAPPPPTPADKAKLMKARLYEWLPGALEADQATARKVACLVWFDKLSELIPSNGRILNTVRSTAYGMAYDHDKVVRALVDVFGYDEQFAHWRVGGRAMK